MDETTAKARLLEIIRPEFAVTRGKALPLGATVERGGVNFALFSEHATAVTLVLYRAGDPDPVAEFPLAVRCNRTGNVWHVFVDGLDPGVEYSYRIDRHPNPTPRLHPYDPGCLLLDPYARGTARVGFTAANGQPRRCLRRSVVLDSHFDWEQDHPLDTPMADSIFYELHVRAFTQDGDAQVRAPGTFSGLTEKIPYLKDLGITAVELMPVAEFDEHDNPRHDPATGGKLGNVWGYHPLSFFSPHLAYGRSPASENTLVEMKDMVKAFHRAGIEVILDVVFNHTGESDAEGEPVSFRGIDNTVYYMLEPESGADRNYSGCGNTLNCNHPVVRELVLDCLRYWVTEFHVDGFRFDLASILGRGTDGAVLANPPLIERIAADPVLAKTKLIAEAWDASGLYQVGSFPEGQRWAEWNGQFRDDIRRYVRGDAGMVPALATRLAGSSDLYQRAGRSPCHSVNFITCHDGFTLADLVAYNRKHNEANGEGGRDGCNDNFSWNCGVEGPTRDREILCLRNRQIRNFVTLLLFSHGVPMLLYGDESGRTQRGNNNVYCQDNDLSWMPWSSGEPASLLFLFFRRLIAFRRAHRVLRRGSFTPQAGEPRLEMGWHGTRLHQPDWSAESRALALHLAEHDGAAASDHVYLISNAHWGALEFELPQICGWRWARFVDTGASPSEASTEPGCEARLSRQQSYPVGPRSTVVLVGKREAAH